ncbi:MAG TPA: peptidylprolyl isomerase [Fimbriimonadaceae bacterium]|nr:peptidylprolyl isomerase [Fimbriimonadaceae bacterium]
MSIRTLVILALVGLFAIALTGCDPEKAAGVSDNQPKAAKDDSSTKSGGDAVKTPERAMLPAKEAPENGDQVAVIDTDKGQIVFMFYPEVAPKTVANFISLANKGFYNGTRFHRTIENFMIQGGDPNSKDLTKSASWGMGGNTDASGKEITVPAEFSKIKHVRGIVSMARSQDPNSASSQFFIVHGDSSFLDGQYTAFGKVVSGINVVDEIAKLPVQDNNGTVFPNRAVVIKKISIQTWPLKS